MSSNEPVKNGCEVIYEMFHILIDILISNPQNLQYMKHFHIIITSHQLSCFTTAHICFTLQASFWLKV